MAVNDALGLQGEEEELGSKIGKKWLRVHQQVFFVVEKLNL